MILVDVVLSNLGDITSLHLKGHAGMDEEGKDLVCAGASTCFIGSLNALTDIDNYIINIEKGLGSIIVKDKLEEHDKIVLEVLLTQLKSIEESYPQNLKINIEKEGTK